MHTTDGGSANVPAFLTKLWRIVEDPLYDHLISWRENGKSFVIKDQTRFAKELLPLFFKHNNMASFIRQLNMYGFRKMTSIENSGLRSERDDMEFYHQCFVKDQEGLLEFIKRKASLQVPAGKGGDEDKSLKKEEVRGLLTDIKSIRGRQESVDSVLVNMQRENEALWREIAILRQKHQKQQQIVEKLIQFLLSLVHNRSQIGIKRKFPLMIDGSGLDLPDVEPTKARKLSGGSSNSAATAGEGEGNGRKGKEAVSGPVIHDVTNDILEAHLEAAANVSPIVTVNAGEMSPSQLGLVEDTSGEIDAGLLLGSPMGSVTSPVEPLSSLDPLALSGGDSLIEPVLELASSDPNGMNTDPSSSGTGFVQQLPSSGLNTPPVTPGAPAGMSETMDLVPSTLSTPSLGATNVATFNKDTFTDQLDGIETELYWLQEQLSQGGFNIDPNALLGVGPDASSLYKLFASDDDNNLLDSMPSTSRLSYNSNEIVGNELTQYMPPVDLDLTGLTPEPSVGGGNPFSSNLDLSGLSTPAKTDSSGLIDLNLNHALLVGGNLAPGNEDQLGVALE